MRKILTVIAVLVVLTLITVGIVQYVTTSDDADPTGEPGVTGTSAAPEQPDWCPAVEFISAPGTWESEPNDDPINPTANPWSFMLSVTQPLQERYYADKLSITSKPGARIVVANGDDYRLRQRLDDAATTWVTAADAGAWADPLQLVGRHNRTNAAIARALLVAAGIDGADDDDRVA